MILSAAAVAAVSQKLHASMEPEEANKRERNRLLCEPLSSSSSHSRIGYDLLRVETFGRRAEIGSSLTDWPSRRIKEETSMI